MTGNVPNHTFEDPGTRFPHVDQGIESVVGVQKWKEWQFVVGIVSKICIVVPGQQKSPIRSVVHPSENE